MGLAEIIVIALFFFLPGALVARSARRHGKTWLLWAIAGLVFSWIGAIVLLLVLDRGPDATRPDA